MARTCVDAGYVLSFAGTGDLQERRGAARGGGAACPTTSCSSRPTRRSSPRTRTGAGANEPYCLPWTVRGLAAVRGVSVERVAAGARRTAETIFGLDDLPPVAAHPSPGAVESRST